MAKQKREKAGLPKKSGQAVGGNTNKVPQDNLKERLKTCQDEIELDYAKKDVIIFSEFTEENHEICDNFYFGITPDNENLVTIFLNRDQIRIIRDLLNDYLVAFEANRRLSKEYSVKARKGELL